MAELRRTLGLAECVFFGVGSILGAGIYTLIGKVAGVSGNLIWLSFFIASMSALFTAFSYAELSAAFPKAGGEYEYAKKAFGKKTGVFLGLTISLNGIISGATVAIGFAGYLSELIGINLLVSAMGIIIVLFGVNVLGIRGSSIVNIIFTLIEVSGLLFVIYVAIPYIGDVNYLEIPANGFNAILAASSLAFFAYIGFEEIVKLAEETKSPEKNIPRALFISSIIVMVTYSLVAISAVSVIPNEDLGNSSSPLADVIGKDYGKTGVIIISVIALFATGNTILSNMVGSSRVILNMSKETKAMKLLSYISPKRKSPLYALVLILLLMLGFALIGNIETIARIATVFIFITFIVVNLSVIVLRIRQKEIPRPYRIPWNINNIPVLSVMGIISTLVLLGYTIYSLLM
ncbi:MAG: amino acid permease [Bacteroidetes bacterium]|nr:amino acid permease [Bacteroidota bacterium]MBK8414690.1 amino acid permease [Bacteroidota bacterium]MBK9422847.1 amino acid permease [Bacteroidota bacterium]